MYIISRCLLGFNCKYDGGNNKNDGIVEYTLTPDSRRYALPIPKEDIDKSDGAIEQNTY